MNIAMVSWCLLNILIDSKFWKFKIYIRYNVCVALWIFFVFTGYALLLKGKFGSSNTIQMATFILIGAIIIILLFNIMM